MKRNFLYQITVASRTPDYGATAPRPPFSLSSVLNWICWTPHPNKIHGYATAVGGKYSGLLVMWIRLRWTKLKGAAAKLTLYPLMWRIWWAPNNASKWQMGFNSAFKGLKRTKWNNLRESLLPFVFTVCRIEKHWVQGVWTWITSQTLSQKLWIVLFASVHKLREFAALFKAIDSEYGETAVKWWEAKGWGESVIKLCVGKK
jgi:hypothetical protein